jgi:hypothetical protein
MPRASSMALVLMPALLGVSIACSPAERKGQPASRGTAHGASTSPTAATRPTDALDVAEAVFRYQFEHNASAVQQGAKAYFLRVGKDDPPAELLARFKGHAPPVRPGSQFKMGDGLSFYVGEMKWVDGTHVEVYGGYYEGLLSASGNTYTVEKRNGKWVVTGDQLQVIS